MSFREHAPNTTPQNFTIFDLLIRLDSVTPQEVDAFRKKVNPILLNSFERASEECKKALTLIDSLPEHELIILKSIAEKQDIIPGLHSIYSYIHTLGVMTDDEKYYRIFGKKQDQ